MIQTTTESVTNLSKVVVLIQQPVTTMKMLQKTTVPVRMQTQAMTATVHV